MTALPLAFKLRMGVNHVKSSIKAVKKLCDAWLEVRHGVSACTEKINWHKLPSLPSSFWRLSFS